MSYLKHKPGSIEELVANEATKLNDNAYQDMFKKELDKAGTGIGSMSPKEKKDFFNKIDSKYKAKNEEVQESASQVQVKRDGKGNFNLMLRGKEIGYYHKSGSKYMVYYDKDGDDYDQSDEVSSEMQAKKLAYDNMNEARFEVKEEDAYDKDDEKPKNKPKKEEVKEADDGDKRNDDPCWKGYKMVGMKNKGGKEVPNCVPMSNEELQEAGIDPKDVKKDLEETHTGQTKKANNHQRSANGEKEVIKSGAKLKFKEAYKKVKENQKTVDDSISDNANQEVSGEEDKKNDPDMKKPKKVADTGSKATSIDTSPEVEYKN